MSALDLSTSVGEWVKQHPQTSRVFESLRIDYCCGGASSLGDACQKLQIDPQGVLASLAEALLKQDDSINWSERSMTELCNHIEETHHAYLRRELPRLTAIIEKVADVHGDSHPKLDELVRAFAELRAELEPHLFKEEQILFPAIRQLEVAEGPLTFPFGTVGNPIAMMEEEHDHAGGGLGHLRSLTNDYTPPADACNTFRAMMDGLRELELDLHQHIHKENNVLFPRAIAYESAAQ